MEIFVVYGSYTLSEMSFPVSSIENESYKDAQREIFCLGVCYAYYEIRKLVKSL